jgi:hypothetical protein
MVLVVHARERVNLSRAFEKRPRWVVHSDFRLGGGGNPSAGLLWSNPLGSSTRAIMCVPECCEGSFVDDCFCRAIMVVDDSPFSDSPLCGAWSSLLHVLAHDRVCSDREGVCTFLLD